MRTVTFSEASVSRVLNEYFICTWVNREPGFHNCDLTAERMITEYDMFATKNFCTFFATPDLDVLHYASGFYKPEPYLREVRFVRELQKAVLDGRNRYMEDALPEFRDLHVQHAHAHDLEAGEQQDALRQGKEGERSKHLQVGLRHLADVHLDLVGKAAGVNGPVPLDSVFRNYLFGNPFQESGDRGKGRRRDPPPGPGME